MSLTLSELTDSELQLIEIGLRTRATECSLKKECHRDKPHYLEYWTNELDKANELAERIYDVYAARHEIGRRRSRRD